MRKENDTKVSECRTSCLYKDMNNEHPFKMDYRARDDPHLPNIIF